MLTIFLPLLSIWNSMLTIFQLLLSTSTPCGARVHACRVDTRVDVQAPPAFATPEERGKDLFVRRCSGCHAADINKEGPSLRGVYGRKAATIHGFDYSDALKKTSIRWDAQTLDRWLTDPDAMVPNTDMAFRVADSEERKSVIAYLKTLTN
jgi:cytochrome c